MLYLGDGKSVADPLDADARAELCEAMVKKQVGFFAVPLGDRPRLRRTCTGWSAAPAARCVRHGTTRGKAERRCVARPASKDVAEPILYYAETHAARRASRKSLPSQCRRCAATPPTLVVGKLEGDAKRSDLQPGRRGRAARRSRPTQTLQGARQRRRATTSWPASTGSGRRARTGRRCCRPTAPWRYAHKQNQLAVEDLLAKAEMALEQNKLDAAEKLFEQAQQLDPHTPGQGRPGADREDAGRQEDARGHAQGAAHGRRQARGRSASRTASAKIVVLDDGDEKDDAQGRRPAARATRSTTSRPAARSPSSRPTSMVNEAIRQANRLVRSNPDEAYRIARSRPSTTSGATPTSSPRPSRSLASRLSRAMESIGRVGDVVKRDQAEALALRAAADARLDLRRTAERWPRTASASGCASSTT